jgi:Zn-dependent protease with chaperone function
MGHSRVRTVAGPALLALGTAWVAGRLLAPREPSPAVAAVDIRDYFGEGEIVRGRRFARGQLALGLARAVLDLIALSAVVRRPARALPGREGAASAAAAGAGLSIAMSLPGLPLSALARRRSIRVGLATQSWRAWGQDLAKAQAIEAAFAAAGSASVTALARRWPERWWLPAAAGSVLIGAAVSALAPVMLDPIFNDFTPLAEGGLRADVLGLAAAAGVKVGEVYSVDASRRTTAANAYVTGLGPTKRIVLFDTLLDRYSPDQVRVVVAHELAHVRHREVPRSIAFVALTAPAAALAVQRLSWTLSEERATARALPALALAGAIVAVPVGLIANRLSRAAERRADAFSLALSDAPDAFVSFERQIALQNVADLDPPRAMIALLATHPPTAERIGIALAYRERDGATAAGAP